MYSNARAAVDVRVQDLLDRLTLAEKARFLSGQDLWRMRAVERLGIPPVQVTDCGHGVTVILDEAGRYTGCATCFPTAVAQAASWDRSLVRDIGAAIAREARHLGSAILLAPMVNIHRTPLGGRNYETYSEDPLLAGTLAAAFVEGVQSEHVGAVIKAMTANNQQTNQHNLNVIVSERALREIYLPAFRIPIQQADPWGVMTAYNALNGHPTCESRHLITDILKGEWRYPGFVVSDWRSVQSARSLAAGLDIEMPGPGRVMSPELILRAVADGELTRRELDDRVGRYLRALVKSKLLDHERPKLATEWNSAAHRRLAQRAAEASLVLLKNESGVLPLQRARLRRLAVIGPNAAAARLGGGGSASVTPCHTVDPLQGLTEYCHPDVEIRSAEGVAMRGAFPLLTAEHLRADVTGQEVAGLRAEYFANGRLDGKPVRVRTERAVDYSWGWAAPCPEVGKSKYSVRWTARIRPPKSGTYRIGVTCRDGGFRLRLDGHVRIDRWERPERTFEATLAAASESVQLDLEQGRTCALCLEFRKRGNRNTIRLEWQPPDAEDSVRRAADVARSCDAAVVFAGLSNLFEGGTLDRKSLQLPAGQDALIREVARANPRTIVVLINGTPVTMPWLDQVEAVLEAYYPGQEGGHAIARVLFGDVNPSGKLPETFPRRLQDNPAHGFFPGEKGRVVYGEGIYVGYRHYDARDIQPLFPFGHGLSYTTFAYRDLQVQRIAPAAFRVTVVVENTGTRAGAEVVQCYVTDLDASVDRPPQELKGYAKVFVPPRGRATVVIDLDRAAFAFFSPRQRRWVVEPGEFAIRVGGSSRAIRLQQRVTVSAGAPVPP